jgi:regulator of protease activity HflC (stomatin/prohibitin superfamily)
MAFIRRFGPWRHLRADASSHVIHYRKARLVRDGRGLSFFFLPHSASLAEIPVDDREMPILVHGRSADYQDVTIQGVLTFRVSEPRILAQRVDFTIDLARGTLLRQPLEKLALVFGPRAEQYVASWVSRTELRAILTEGPERARAAIEAGLAEDAAIAEMGLAVVSVRVSSVRPTPDIEKALAAPTRERIQQQADEAAFARRALAVEKERAIQENELKNQIELARRKEELILQEGQNARKEATEEAEAARIAAEATAQRAHIEAEAAALRIRGEAEATGHRVRTEGEAAAHRTRVQGEADAAALGLAEKVRTESERARMDTVRDISPAVLLGLAAQALAGKLEKIEHLNLGPDAIGPALERLLEAGAKRLGTE